MRQGRSAETRSDQRFLVKRSASEIDHRVGGGQDRLRRPIVASSVMISAFASEVAGEIEDVPDGCGPEGIDRLRVVTNHGQAAPFGLSASRIEACSRLVSWYSSTSTWSKRSARSCAIEPSAIMCAQ